MWHREFRDYKTDEPNVKQPVQPGRGISGCEMHEINGWGNTIHHPKKRKRGLIATLIANFFGSNNQDGS